MLAGNIAKSMTSQGNDALLPANVRASGRSREKKSNFVGFLGTYSRKNQPILQEFFGSFRGKLHQKAIGKKMANFVAIFKANFTRNRSVLRRSDQNISKY